MPLSPEDEQVVRDMRQRELTEKKRRRAISVMRREHARYRLMLLALVALAFAVLGGLAYASVRGFLHDAWPRLWQEIWPVLIVAAVLGWLAGSVWLRSSSGQRLLARKDRLLNERHSGDLYAGRRWQQFYYKGEEISAYVPQILFTLDSGDGIGTVDEVLARVRETRLGNPRLQARGREIFASIASAADLLVLATSDELGRPSSRFMRFVTSERPGVWYVTSAPGTPKIPEFDRGDASVITVPDESGATISSNRVRLRRAGKSFAEVAELYRAQVPRYLDGMTPDDQALEAVYELVIDSARVSSWEFNEPVVFEHDAELPTDAAGLAPAPGRRA